MANRQTSNRQTGDRQRRAQAGQQPDQDGFTPGQFARQPASSPADSRPAVPGDLVQLATDAVFQAVEALRQRHPAKLRRAVEQLDLGLGHGPIGAQAVNRVLLANLQGGLIRLWARGWQPAELVRVADREHTGRHAKLVTEAIAAAMRPYATATVAPAWQEQLIALGAAEFTSHDDHFVDDWAAGAGLRRSAAVLQALEVTHLFTTLSPLTVLMPPPGNPQPAPRPRAAAARPAGSGEQATDQRMLGKVRALLAKAESTTFPEEAEAFAAKAQQLMARYSIDQALLETRTGTGDGPASIRVPVDNPYEAPKTMLLQVVAEANRCRSVWMKRYGMSTLVGHQTDLEAVEMLFTSLLVQAVKAMTQTSARPDRYGRNTTRSFRQSFLMAYASRIGERLASATEQVGEEMRAEVGADLLPVLSARSDAVNETFDQLFPELISHVTSITNRDGWNSGRAAADRAQLHGHGAVTR